MNPQPRLRSVRTWSGRALAVVTPLGWSVAAVVAGALVLVAVAGWIEAGTVAVIGLLLLAIGVVSVLGRPGARAEIALEHSRTVVGQPVEGSLRVSQHRSARGSVIELPVTVPGRLGDAVSEFGVPALAADQEWSAGFTVPAQRRGLVRLGPPRSVRSDALGLFRRTRQWAGDARVWVHPATIRVPFDATGFASDAEGVTTARLSSSDVSFHALRDYAPGDDRRHVHWPTTARTGRLIVRHFEETKRSHHLILLETDADSWTGHSFEQAVSIAGSLALAGLSANRPVSLATSSGWCSTSSPARTLDALAEVETQDRPTSLPLRIREAVAARPGVSVLTVICGPATRDEDIARWPRLAGVDVITGAVRVTPGGSAARRTLAGCQVLDCPDLSWLPRLIGPGRRR